MQPACLIHTRKYRSEVETLINKVQKTQGIGNVVGSFRQVQRELLCTCGGSCATLTLLTLNRLSLEGPATRHLQAQSTDSLSADSCSGASLTSSAAARCKPRHEERWLKLPLEGRQAIRQAIAACQAQLTRAALRGSDEAVLKWSIDALRLVVIEAAASTVEHVEVRGSTWRGRRVHVARTPRRSIKDEAARHEDEILCRLDRKQLRRFQQLAAQHELPRGRGKHKREPVDEDHRTIKGMPLRDAAACVARQQRKALARAGRKRSRGGFGLRTCAAATPFTTNKP